MTDKEEILLYANEYDDKKAYQKYNITPKELKETRRKVNNMAIKKKEKKIEYIPLGSLKLDFKNPRLPINTSNEADIIKWMLEDASIIELMLAIGQNDFFIGEALLVVEDNNNFVVIEGNRRLTSLKILNNPDLAKIHTKKVQRVLEETKYRPSEIPCIIFDSRNDISQYLGYRHITGIKSWGMLAKAKYLNSLIPLLKTKGLYNQSRELAKKIGSRSDYVKRVLISYKIYEIIKDNNFYKIFQLNETTFHFNYIADSLRYENIKNFINIDLEDNNTLSSINKDNLATLISWFFKKNDQLRSRVYGNSDNLSKLNKILSNKEVTSKFFQGLSLDDAFNLTEIDAGTFTAELYASLQELKTAHSYIHQIKNHNDRDMEMLGEIVNLCKVIRNSINAKDDSFDY